MRTLVAGFGNVLLGDDGFGVEVIRLLERETLPAGTDVVEVGIGGIDFVLKLWDRYDRAVVVDAVHRGDKAGTVYVFSPDQAELTAGPVDAAPHVTEPLRAMRLARELQVLPGSLTVVGCEVGVTELGIGLSEPVRAAVPEAVRRIREILDA